MGSITSTKQQQIKYEQLEKKEQTQTQSILIQTEESMFKIEQNNEQVSEKQADFLNYGIENQKQIPVKQDQTYNKKLQSIQQFNKPQQLLVEPNDQKKLMEIISNYKPQIIEIPFTLKPFIPDYLPALIEVEDALFIPRPDKQEDYLGMKDLRENKAHCFVKSNVKTHVSDAELQFIHDQERIVKPAKLQKLAQQTLQIQKQPKQSLYQEKWYMEGEELQDQIKRLEKFITKYQPKDMVLQAVLKPFIPEYIPALKGPCEMILIPRPDEKPDNIGITTLSDCRFYTEEHQIHDQENIDKTAKLQILAQQPPQVQKQTKKCLYQEEWYMEGENLQDQIKRLEKLIAKYQPKDVVLQPVLKPFIPDYIPALKGPCEMILIPRPDEKLDNIGIKTLPECCFQNQMEEQQPNEIQSFEKT